MLCEECVWLGTIHPCLKLAGDLQEEGGARLRLETERPGRAGRGLEASGARLWKLWGSPGCHHLLVPHAGEDLSWDSLSGCHPPFVTKQKGRKMGTVGQQASLDERPGCLLSEFSVLYQGAKTPAWGWLEC